MFELLIRVDRSLLPLLRLEGLGCQILHGTSAILHLLVLALKLLFVARFVLI